MSFHAPIRDRCVPFRGAGGGFRKTTLLAGLGVPQRHPALAPSHARHLLVRRRAYYTEQHCLYHDLLGGGRYFGAPSTSTASIGDSNAMNRTQGPAFAQRASCLALAGPYVYEPALRTAGFCPS